MRSEAGQGERRLGPTSDGEDLLDKGPSHLGDEALRHVANAGRLAAGGEGAHARGAWRVAITSALRLATTSPASETQRDAIEQGCGDFLANLDDERRAHVAALFEAARWGHVEHRLVQGLRPHAWGTRTGHLGRTNGGRRMDVCRSGVQTTTPDDLAAYVAAGAADVSSSLADVLGALRAVLALGDRGESTEAAWVAFDAAALGLCVEPAASLADRVVARRVLLMVWLTARRRRPIVAAVLRRRLLIDRRRWPGLVG